MYSAILFAALSCHQCSDGVCKAPAVAKTRERSVVVKMTKIVEAQPVRKAVRERQPVRRVLKWIGRR